VVFRGFDPSIGRPVAIKVINKTQSATNQEDAELRLRFQREAAAAGRLSHPNIVAVYQLGEDQNTQYLVMELIEGRSLERILSEERLLTPTVALPLLSQIADALDYAHREGVVHRDIKPANILVRSDGKVKLTDFGIARIAAQAMTKTGLTMGTPAYMAPEQIQSARVSGKADQFSLGVLSYEMLCGRKPFVADSTAALMYRIISEEPSLAHVVNPAVSPRVSSVLTRALAKDPEKRLSTCREFVQLLSDAIESPTTAASSPVIPTPASRLASGKRFSQIALGLAAAVVVFLGVAGILLMRHFGTSKLPQPEKAISEPVSPAEASVIERGDALVKAQKYEAALAIFVDAAQAGSADALERVGSMYERGWGVTESTSEALNWYRRAADAGSPAAMTKLGSLYDRGKGIPFDYGEALKWYRRAVDRGDKAALYHIGSLYEAGKGVPRDVDEARRWYQRASESGNSGAAEALRRLDSR
jgi:serine/threonine protein kinase